MVCLDLSDSSSSWGLGRAAVCDCGTPWTFLLPFLYGKYGKYSSKSIRTKCHVKSNSFYIVYIAFSLSTLKILELPMQAV